MDQAAPELTTLPVSASLVLGLQVCTWHTRSEDKLWELVFFFHHVGLRVKIKLSWRDDSSAKHLLLFQRT